MTLSVRLAVKVTYTFVNSYYTTKYSEISQSCSFERSENNFEARSQLCYSTYYSTVGADIDSDVNVSMFSMSTLVAHKRMGTVSSFFLGLQYLIYSIYLASRMMTIEDR